MRRIVIWLASTVTVVVLLFGYHTSTNSSGTSTPSSSARAPAVPAGPSSSSGSAAGTRTSTGDVVQTRWGAVQVAITVAGGRITKVTVLQHPTGNPRDTEINDRALPVLVQETLDAQSAKIDVVSGATLTSNGYMTSLQSALDKAGI